MKKLPIEVVLPTIVSTLETSNTLVLQAPPGAGKTTMVPLALLDAPWLGDKKIIMLEPRRIATRSSAQRMAELLDELLGERVGYRVRAESCVSAKSKIIVVTEGILTRMLQSDPELQEVGLLIFDEFHERNLHGDLGLALALESQALLREDLKIVVMSATLNAKRIATLLQNAPIVTSEGRTYPVENIYLTNKTPHPTPKTLLNEILKIIKGLLTTDTGSILIFLPGVGEIKKLEQLLLPLINTNDIILAPLYGALSTKEQNLAIKPSSQRKIVLATNIAETSLTIEGISVVIDSGLQRSTYFDAGSGMNRLVTQAISQDSATQRSGRAGRLSAGRCYRLWHEHRPLVKHNEAEIVTADLTSFVLELALWGVNEIQTLEWLDLPSPTALSHAKALLHQLGALKENCITPHGKKMLHLGVHPRLAHMMLHSQKLGLTQSAAYLAALLSEKDILRGSLSKSADLEPRLQAVQNSEQGPHINTVALQRVKLTAKNFMKKLLESKKSESIKDRCGVLLGFAYPDRIAQSRGTNDQHYLLSNAKGASLHFEDTLFTSSYLVVADAQGSSKNATIYRAAALTLEQIKTYFSEHITLENETQFNFQEERIEAREVLKLGALSLESNPIKKLDETMIRSALIEAIKHKGLKALAFSKESLNLCARIAFVRHNEDKIMEADNFPDLSERWLLDNLELWLAPHLQGIKTFKACSKLNTTMILQSLLTYDQNKRLEMLAPKKLSVPSGSNITINYENPQAPTLEVRLQELFGMYETPKLMDNKVALTIALLSPASRPMQVTKDLRSFWETTYHEVRKELRGKYKRHYWPEDPFEAIATSKTKKRMFQ